MRTLLLTVCCLVMLVIGFIVGEGHSVSLAANPTRYEVLDAKQAFPANEYYPGAPGVSSGFGPAKSKSGMPESYCSSSSTSTRPGLWNGQNPQSGMNAQCPATLAYFLNSQAQGGWHLVTIYHVAGTDQFIFAK